MKPRFVLMTILAAALLVGGMTMMDTRGEALAGDAQSLQGAAAPSQPIILAEVRLPTGMTTRGTVSPSKFPIVVSKYLKGRIITRGNMLTVTWTVAESLMREPRFRITLLKGRDRTVKASYMGSGRIDPPRTYQKMWRIPADFDTGSDFFVKVTHLPTKSKGYSGFFTIR